MKHTAWHLLGGLLLLFSLSGSAQVKNPAKKEEKKVEQKTNQKVDQTIDKDLNDLESGVKGLFKKKDAKAQSPLWRQS